MLLSQTTLGPLPFKERAKKKKLARGFCCLLTVHHVSQMKEEREGAFPSLFNVFLELVSKTASCLPIACSLCGLSNRIPIVLKEGLCLTIKPHFSASFANEVVKQMQAEVTGEISGELLYKELTHLEGTLFALPHFLLLPAWNTDIVGALAAILGHAVNSVGSHSLSKDGIAEGRF